MLKISGFFKTNHLGYRMPHFNLICRELEHSDVVFILIIAFENQKNMPGTFF